MSDITSVTDLFSTEAYAGTYRGLDVFPGFHNGMDDIPEGLARNGQLVETVTGLRKFVDRSTTPFPTRSIHWYATTRVNALAMRSFIAARSGRLVPFWVPTFRWDLDFLVYYPLDPTNKIVIAGCKYQDLLFPNPARRHLAVFPRALSSMQFTKVTAAATYTSTGTGTAGTTTTEVLTLDAPVTDCSNKITRICFLTLCRLANDMNDITWHGLNAAEVTLPLVELPLEVPA